MVALSTNNARFVVKPQEIRFVSAGEFGGWCFVWLDILDAQNQSNTPHLPYGWHVKFFPPEVSIAQIFVDGHFSDHLNWALVSRSKMATTEELTHLARCEMP